MNKLGTKFLFLLLSATRTVWKNRTMTLSLMVSYALGWLLPVAILSASNHELFRLKSMGMSESERVISVYLDPLSVLPTDKIGDRAQREEEIMKGLHAEIEKMKPLIEQVTHRTEGSGTLSTVDRIRMIHVNYVPENYVLFFDRLLSGGRWLSREGKGECVMGTALSTYFFSNSSLHRQVRFKGKPCTVVGETQVFSNYLLLPEEEWSEGEGNKVYYIKVKEEADVDEVMDRMAGISPDLVIETMEAQNRRLLSGAVQVFAVLFLLSLIALLYALFNIWNTIRLMIEERKGKYGIQRSLGASRFDLWLEFFFELLFITIISLLFLFGLMFLLKPIVERDIVPMKIDGFVIGIVFSLNLFIVSLIGFLALRRQFKQTIVALIRGTGE